MISLLIGIFLVILFIVTIVLSVSTWRAWHIVAASLTFLAAVGLVIVGSLSLKTHNYWRKTHADVSKKLTTAVQDGIVSKYGDPTLVESPEPSVNDLQDQLNRALLDRGRVWRRCTPGAPANNAIQISTVPPTETGEAGDPNTAKPNGIAADMVLYAFLEDASQNPVAYLGEFLVMDAQPANVTLQPTMLLDAVQQAKVAVQPARWTLYEMLPLDAHHVFSDEDTLGKSLDDTPQPVFGKMDEQKLREVFAMVTEQPTDSPLVTDLVAAYLKDGSPAAEQEVNQFPENVWLKLEFKKEYKARVNSPNPSAGIDDKYFDPEGYAVAAQLRRSAADGEEAVVRVGDVGIFPYAYDLDKRAVDGLLSSDTCRSLGPYYVRSLRDYEEAFHDLQSRYMHCMEAGQRAQRDLDYLKATIVKTQGQIAFRQEEQTKLQQDLQGVERDRTKVTELAVTLEAQKTSLLEALSSLFRTNVALEQQLNEFNAKLTEEINRRAAAVATVQSP